MATLLERLVDSPVSSSGRCGSSRQRTGGHRLINGERRTPAGHAGTTQGAPPARRSPTADRLAFGPRRAPICKGKLGKLTSLRKAPKVKNRTAAPAI
jgi:hypothetical protein